MTVMRLSNSEALASAATTSDALQSVCLRADPSVVGSLAFRLIGSKASGVFVYSLHATSHQARQLENGDKLLVCNDIPLQGLTCEQVANILRLSMFRNGTVWLTVAKEAGRKDRMERRCSRDKLVLAEQNIINNNVHEKSDKLSTSKPMKPLCTSSSLISGFAYEAQLRRVATTSTSAAFSTSASSTHPRGKKWRRTTANHREDRIHLLTAAENETEDGVGRFRKTSFYCLDVNGNTRIEHVDDRYRCPICLQYIRLKRWHMLKHEWISSAKRLLPASASEFFVHRDTSMYAML